MNKHTKGPWHAVEVDSRTIGKHFIIVMSDPLAKDDNVPDYSLSALAKVATLDHQLDKANAKLMASAPALLEACKKAKIFIQYARYELEDGKATIGDQFPRKQDADIEMGRLAQAIAESD